MGMATTKTPKRGRPPVLPWKTEIPALIKMRKEGFTYADIADNLSERFNVKVTPQTVRARVSPFVTSSVERALKKAQAADRQALNQDDALLIAQWLVAHPGGGRQLASVQLGIPLSRVENLSTLAYTLIDGYVISPAKIGREQLSNKMMIKALKDCAKDLSVRKTDRLSQGNYDTWRKEQAPDRREQLPSPIAYRRRFGTWTSACEAAGLTAHDLPRTYDGLSTQDIVLHVAMWLRDLTERRKGLIDASQSQYRLWLRIHPEAPSEELIRLRGSWASILTMASEVERTTKKLPTPKPVGTSGRRKKPVKARATRK